MINMKALLVLSLMALAGCAGNSGDNTDTGPTKAPPTQIAGFHLDHELTNLVGCVTVHSTDTSKVRLVGPTCLDDGSECYDGADNTIEVYVTDEPLTGAPYGAASFVSVVPC